MSEGVNLVQDLALIFISAGLFTLISKALKQPLILGYIIAGFLVGPHIGLFPSITNTALVHEWSEIGIIFLLFALGLEFSFKKLIRVGASALITAVTKCIGMFLVGLVLGSILKFTTMESIFLGGLLSMSSTTIIIKVYDEMGLKKKPYSTLIFGSLVFEDLIAILLLVLLSTLAVSNKFAGSELIMGIGKLVFFMILWFLVGIYIIPTLLKKARKIMSDEILLMVSIGLCFGMVAIASYVGFSSALGAFVMGSILAETIEGERIEHLLGGIKDIFGAVFFVSVGMMVDPYVIIENWLPILIITIFTVVGILLFSTVGALISGQGLSTALHAGFSLAQLGEFAFIIAGLGCSLGVMRDFIYPVIIAVSVITTFTTPYMIKAAGPVTDWLMNHLPEKFIKKMTPAADSGRASTVTEKSEWHKYLRIYFTRIVLYGVILVAILLGSHLYLGQFVDKVLPDLSDTVSSFVRLGITLLVMLPFLFGVVSSTKGLTQSANSLIRENSINKWFIHAMIIFRYLIALGVIMVTTINTVQLLSWAMLIIVAIVIILFLFCRRYLNSLSFIEDKFFRNLNEKEEMEAATKPIITSVSKMLTGYDVHLEIVEIAYESNMAGKAIRDLPLRNTHNINIVKIQRGNRLIMIPDGDEVIYPKDLITVVGTSENINRFKNEIEEGIFNNTEEADLREYGVEKVEVSRGSYLDGKVLRDTNMRSRGCMVISILRGDDFITTPDADFVFGENDIVWLAGDMKACEFYK